MPDQPTHKPAIGVLLSYDYSQSGDRTVAAGVAWGMTPYLAPRVTAGSEKEVIELLWALYNAAWDTDGLPTAEIFCGAEPDAEPFVIGLYGSCDRELAFYAHPDLRDLSCAAKEDLQDLHTRLARTTSNYRPPKDDL